jgi:hypothetical protein
MEKVAPITREQFLELEQFNFDYEHKEDIYGIVDNNIVVVDYG